MDELLDVFEFDLGELVAGGLQLVLAALLLVLGVVLLLASIFVDGLLLWGGLLVVAGLVVGLLAVSSFLDAIF